MKCPICAFQPEVTQKLGGVGAGDVLSAFGIEDGGTQAKELMEQSIAADCEKLENIAMTTHYLGHIAQSLQLMVKG